ncbi:MAG: aspartate/glutamate racemase family protein [Acetobacter sp.]|nr:aspartate/glutamate racemase family protein [Acetobacter sp.]
MRVLPDPLTTPFPSFPYRVLAFDSGIGGLGIVGALHVIAPHLCIDYLADTAVFPYGEQDDTQLIQRIVTLLSNVIDRLHPHAVVVACNTASTLALEALRSTCPKTPFIGCVPPIRWASRLTHTRVIGLLATKATSRRPYLNTLQTLYAPECTLITHAAPGLAKLAEHVFRGLPVTDTDFENELEGLLKHPQISQIDTIGIGCTHYTFVLDRLRALLPSNICWLDPAKAVARQTCAVLSTQPPHPTPLPHMSQMPQAWFTALPKDMLVLLEKFALYGFKNISLWDDNTN